MGNWFSAYVSIGFSGDDCCAGFFFFFKAAPVWGLVFLETGSAREVPNHFRVRTVIGLISGGPKVCGIVHDLFEPGEEGGLGDVSTVVADGEKSV